jgi:hypothetical protein
MVLSVLGGSEPIGIRFEFCGATGTAEPPGSSFMNDAGGRRVDRNGHTADGVDLRRLGAVSTGSPVRGSGVTILIIWQFLHGSQPLFVSEPDPRADRDAVRRAAQVKATNFSQQRNRQATTETSTDRADQTRLPTTK